MKVVVLHGLGQTTSDWNLVDERLSQEMIVVDLFKNMNDSSRLSIKQLLKKIENELSRIDEPFILVGLSLGGLLTLKYIINIRNEYLKGGIVCGAIYKSIPRTINFIQIIAIKLLSENKLKK